MWVLETEQEPVLKIKDEEKREQPVGRYLGIQLNGRSLLHGAQDPKFNTKYSQGRRKDAGRNLLLLWRQKQEVLVFQANLGDIIRMNR